jgi:hypothetical protein
MSESRPKEWRGNHACSACTLTISIVYKVALTGIDMLEFE